MLLTHLVCCEGVEFRKSPSKKTLLLAEVKAKRVALQVALTLIHARALSRSAGLLVAFPDRD